MAIAVGGQRPATSPLRVLLVNFAAGFGGAEVRVLTLAGALQGRVADCRVAVLAGRRLHERLVGRGLAAVPIDLGRGNPLLASALRRAIADQESDIVDAHNVQSILWGHLAAWFAGVRGRVATIHSNHGAEYGGLKGRFYDGVLSFDRSLARETIVVTEALLATYRRGSDDRHITLVPNALPVADGPLPPADAAARQRLGLAAGDFVVLVPARLNEVKGHRFLIDAAAQLGDLPQLTIVAAGDGPLRAELETAVAARGLTRCLRFIGFVDDLAPWLAASDCVCLPSLTEAMPFALMEAAAASRAVIASAVGGIPSLVRDGETGLLVPPANSAALAAGLRWLATHPERCRALGRAAWTRARSEGGIDVMVARTLDVYQRACR